MATQGSCSLHAVHGPINNRLWFIRFYYYYYYYSIVIIVIIFYVKSVYGVNMISVFSKGELNPIITVLAGSNKVIPVNNSC